MLRMVVWHGSHCYQCCCFRCCCSCHCHQFDCGTGSFAMLTSGSHAWEKQELLQAEVLVVMPSSTKWSQASWWRRAMTWLARNGMNATTPPVWVPLMKGPSTRGVAVRIHLAAACPCRRARVCLLALGVSARRRKRGRERASGRARGRGGRERARESAQHTSCFFEALRLLRWVPRMAAPAWATG
jgi:hypothetical protein